MIRPGVRTGQDFKLRWMTVASPLECVMDMAGSAEGGRTVRTSQSEEESLEKERLSGVRGESGGVLKAGAGLGGRGTREGDGGSNGGSGGSRAKARVLDLVVRAGAETTRLVLARPAALTGAGMRDRVTICGIRRVGGSGAEEDRWSAR